MNGQLPRLDILFAACFLYESFGQRLLFPVGDHPSDDVTTEDVQDHVEVIVGPFHRALKLGDIPGPDLIWPCGQEFGLLVDAALMPSSSLFDTAVF